MIAAFSKFVCDLHTFRYGRIAESESAFADCSDPYMHILVCPVAVLGNLEGGNRCHQGVPLPPDEQQTGGTVKLLVSVKERIDYSKPKKTLAVNAHRLNYCVSVFPLMPIASLN